MKNELESYLAHGGSFQPNFGWKNMTFNRGPNTLLYDLVQKDPKNEKGKEMIKTLQKQKEIKEGVQMSSQAKDIKTSPNLL